MTSRQRLAHEDEEPREVTRVTAPRKQREDAPEGPPRSSPPLDEGMPEADEPAHYPAPKRAEPAPETSPLGYTPFELPSRGLFYGPDSVIPTPDIPNGRIEVRKMRIAEEEALSSGGGDVLSKLSKIVQAVTILPKGFDPMSLLITDRFFVLLALRRLGLGPIYPVTFRCSECGAHNKVNIDIVNELSMKTGTEGVREPLLIDLPDAKVQVGMRFRRGFDEVEIARERRRAETRGTDLPLIQENLRRQLVEIDGEPVTNAMVKMDLIRKLTQTDNARIRVTLEKSEPGIDTTITPECRRCQFVNEFDMPFTNEFFRPTDV